MSSVTALMKQWLKQQLALLAAREEAQLPALSWLHSQEKKVSEASKMKALRYVNDNGCVRRPGTSADTIYSGR